MRVTWMSRGTDELFDGDHLVVLAEHLDRLLVVHPGAVGAVERQRDVVPAVRAQMWSHMGATTMNRRAAAGGERVGPTARGVDQVSL